jgi:predicted ABC-type transport system involved in lysophospholipase L1 biosynthesis ATPase subunit
MVTHDMNLAQRARRMVTMEDGNVVFRHGIGSVEP